jgi:hypothetical protein
MTSGLKKCGAISSWYWPGNDAEAGFVRSWEKVDFNQFTAGVEYTRPSVLTGWSDIGASWKMLRCVPV